MEIINILLISIGLLACLVMYLLYSIQELYKDLSKLETKLINYVNTVNESSIEVSTKVINESNNSLKNNILKELKSIENDINEQIKVPLASLKEELNEAVKEDMQKLTAYGEAVEKLYLDLTATSKPTKKSNKKNGVQ